MKDINQRHAVHKPTPWRTWVPNWNIASHGTRHSGIIDSLYRVASIKVKSSSVISSEQGTAGAASPLSWRENNSPQMKTLATASAGSEAPPSMAAGIVVFMVGKGLESREGLSQRIIRWRSRIAYMYKQRHWSLPIRVSIWLYPRLWAKFSRLPNRKCFRGLYPSSAGHCSSGKVKEIIENCQSERKQKHFGDRIV